MVEIHFALGWGLRDLVPHGIYTISTRSSEENLRGKNMGVVTSKIRITDNMTPKWPLQNKVADFSVGRLMIDIPTKFDVPMGSV